MNFYIFTIFPDSLKPYFESSILGRAQKEGLINIETIDIRDFSEEKHKMTDDRPFGGGAGMVMKVEPIVKAIESVFETKEKKPSVIITTTSGKQFDQKIAMEFSKKGEDLVIICGHYEGLDERIGDVLSELGYDVQEFSAGPYILTGGELPAAIMVEAISRHQKGVLGKEESLEEIKGSYPVYTRPEVFEYRGKEYKVPEVLLSGNHKKIAEWRKNNSK
ncbi:MAG: tRNA (guanosine(37)-N1)-methyltransferase TrmD [Patescibacteria group bacterium]